MFSVSIMQTFYFLVLHKIAPGPVNVYSIARTWLSKVREENTINNLTLHYLLTPLLSVSSVVLSQRPVYNLNQHSRGRSYIGRAEPSVLSSNVPTY